ncbi:MAG: hypothetical protein LJE69_09650 [Thiohalocapsa sp.]|jgi:hypothetical protein|uniref:hypothetical protein n=1 Tax=Thiohalocapsa sp. TaxID=2497641 RepID=UPI0025CCBFC7|nr:hypothetical protein [Thiohalocapsa sp.]MCG6941501.1 hypothetical protein [Thiohalocapsa sp.]
MTTDLHTPERAPKAGHRGPGKPSRSRQAIALGWLLLASGVCHAADTAAVQPPVFTYSPNPIETTPYGPAAADIALYPSNFVPCFGGPIALCYYSGPASDSAPETGPPNLSCEVSDDPNFSNCKCIEMPLGPYYVDINGILDEQVYLDTVRVCGETGANCQSQPNMAPVCAAIQSKQLLADADPAPDYISTFTPALDAAKIPGYAIGQTNCASAPYAGCMTAPCKRLSEQKVPLCDGCDEEAYIDVCTCPNYTGPYQVGQANADCNIAGDAPADDPGKNIWSAAYNPTVGMISQLDCVPDAFGNSGCPLLPPTPDSDPVQPAIPEVPQGISCPQVCAEYRNARDDGVEVGYTCDATLCTVSSLKDDAGLVEQACGGLGNSRLGTSEILKLEAAVGCSCCASQICGCEASETTENAVFDLNAEQAAMGIETQCQYNGSLCGSPSPASPTGAAE